MLDASHARVVVPHSPHHVLQRGQLTGTERFVEDIAATIGKRITRRGQSRPKKELDTKQ